VPDSANTAALGYAEQSNIRFEIGLIRNHYLGRTFIDPNQAMRERKVKLKFNTVKGVLKGKRVVLVDDSIVRGTTLRQLVRLVHQSGAAEVHVRISSPPIKHPCFYGIDMQTRGELIAANDAEDPVDQVREFIGADSLGYLSTEGLLKIASENASENAGYCAACFSGT
ncbi:uncharacterized protein METZ01_LOCUS265252, partial [marine metagenome]